MKALSIRQPWAWLIVNGYKDIENRSWSTQYRGPLLVLSSKQPALTIPETKEYFRSVRLPLPKVWELGGIVGIVDVVDCVTSHPSGWFSGPYGFVLANARPLPFYALKGRLGLFDVPDDVVKELKL
jgi:hypothetical protein